MSTVNRVFIRKSGGDDAYSWAVFVDGQRKWTGLSFREAKDYRDRERKRIGAK